MVENNSKHEKKGGKKMEQTNTIDNYFKKN